MAMTPEEVKAAVQAALAKAAEEDTLEARRARRLALEAETVKRECRRRYPGDDAAFEAAWPTIAASIAATKPARRVQPL